LNADSFVLLKMIGCRQNVNTIPRRVRVVLDANSRWYEERERQVVRCLLKNQQQTPEHEIYIVDMEPG
jgi:hypothetical protein